MIAARRTIGAISYSDTLAIVAHAARFPQLRPAPLANLASVFHAAWQVLRRQLEKARTQGSSDIVGDLIKGATDVDGVLVIAREVEVGTADVLPKGGRWSPAPMQARIGEPIAYALLYPLGSALMLWIALRAISRGRRPRPATAHARRSR